MRSCSRFRACRPQNRSQLLALYNKDEYFVKRRRHKRGEGEREGHTLRQQLPSQCFQVQWPHRGLFGLVSRLNTIIHELKETDKKKREKRREESTLTMISRSSSRACVSLAAYCGAWRENISAVAL